MPNLSTEDPRFLGQVRAWLAEFGEISEANSVRNVAARILRPQASARNGGVDGHFLADA